MKIKNKSYDDLVNEYRKLAKRADQRLVRLEGQRHHKKYKNILEFSYKTAIKDIRTYGNKKAKRFNTEPPKDIDDLTQKIADIKKFLNSPTSKVTWMNKIISSLNKTFFGNDTKQYLTWEEYANFFDKNDADVLDNRIEYNMRIVSGGLMKKYKINPDNVQEKLDQFTRKGDIDVLQSRAIEDLLVKQGLSFNKLFK